MPTASMASVEGSGTAAGLARRKPTSTAALDARVGALLEDDKTDAELL